MSKFLEGVEEHTPEKDIDKLTGGKQALQKLLSSKGIKADAKVFQDILNIKLDDGSTVKVEILDVLAPIEDQETETPLSDMLDPEAKEKIKLSSDKIAKEIENIANGQ